MSKRIIHLSFQGDVDGVYFFFLSELTGRYFRQRATIGPEETNSLNLFWL